MGDRRMLTDLPHSVGAPVLIALVTFVFHTKVFHQPLTASTAFTSLALFNVIRSPRKAVHHLMNDDKAA
jgi:hypothetical protein